MTTWHEVWQQFNDPSNGNAICDGLYCGGPFFGSVAWLLVITAGIVGVVGLVLHSAHYARRPPP